MTHTSSCGGPEFKVSFGTQVGWLTPPCISSSMGMGYPTHIQTHVHNFFNKVIFKEVFLRNKIEIDLTNPERERIGKGGLSDGIACCILGHTPYSFLRDSRSLLSCPSSVRCQLASKAAS